MASSSLGSRRASVSSSDSRSPLVGDNRTTIVKNTKTINFAPKDPEDPRNWSSLRKWTIVGVITLIDLTVSWGASGYSPASAKFVEDFNVSAEVGVLGLSLYVLGLAFGPMTIAPLSEYYGRTPLYVIPYGMFLCFLLGTALVQNLGGFLILRFLSGFFSSVTIANFGGTIADLWPRDQVGPAMSVYIWAAVGGSSSGYFLMSFVAESRGWRDVFWALLGICGGFWLIMVIVLIGGKNETRRSVLLRQRAHRMSEQGNQEVEVPEDMQAKGLGQLLRITLSRPFRFLATEAILIFAALYNGYLYGLSFLFNGAFKLVFGPKGYGFGVDGVGLCFLGLFAGITLGPITNIWQERYYQRRIRQGMSEQDQTAAAESGEETRFKNIPEARLQLAKIAAITFPISLWWFAWTCVPSYNIHYMVPILATVLFGWSFYVLLTSLFHYIEDSYMSFAASALAGVGLSRNVFGAGFPLFGDQLFEKEGYNWAGTILAFLAMLLIPIPYVLEKYGPKLRARSPWASQHMDDDQKDDYEDYAT